MTLVAKMATLEPIATREQPSVGGGVASTEARTRLLQSLHVPADDIGGSTVLASNSPDKDSAVSSPANSEEATAKLQIAHSTATSDSDWRNAETSINVDASERLRGGEATRQRQDREEEEEEVLETLRDEEEEVEQLDPLETDVTRIQVRLS